MRNLRRSFEHALWGSRFLLVVGVVFSALLALGAFILATVDALMLPGYLRAYVDLGLEAGARATLRDQALTTIVKAVDGYIITAILIIFSLGLYELAMGRLGVAREVSTEPRLLEAGGLDSLKDRIAKLLILVLVIEFFQRALHLEATRALDLLYLAVGIALIGVTLWLGKPGGSGKAH